MLKRDDGNNTWSKYLDQNSLWGADYTIYLGALPGDDDV